MVYNTLSDYLPETDRDSNNNQYMQNDPKPRNSYNTIIKQHNFIYATVCF